MTLHSIISFAYHDVPIYHPKIVATTYLSSYLLHSRINALKSGVPKPVTASHPSVAGKPSVPHPNALPLVTSVYTRQPLEYSQGFKKPRAGLLLLNRASLTKPKMPACSAAAAPVPEMGCSVPFQTKT